MTFVYRFQLPVPKWERRLVRLTTFAPSTREDGPLDPITPSRYLGIMAVTSKTRAASDGGRFRRMRSSKYSIWALGLFIFYWTCAFLDTIKAWSFQYPCPSSRLTTPFTESMVPYEPRLFAPACSGIHRHARERHREDNRLHRD